MAIDSVNKADSLVDVLRLVSSDQGSDKSTRGEQSRLIFALMKPNVNIPLSIGSPGQMLVVNPGGTGMSYANVPASGSTTFLGLTDTPNSFTAGKGLSVNVGGNALEYVDLVKKFTDLSDTPATLTANQFLKANATGTGFEFATVKVSNIGNSNLTISDNQRWLRLPNTLTTTKFSIQDSTGAEAFSVNGNSTVTLRTKVTGSTGFAVYCNNTLVQLTNQTGTVFDRPVRVNNIQTEHSSLAGTGLSIGTGLGGSAQLIYQPQNGYVTMSPHTSNSPVAPTIANGFGLYPNTTGGVLHPSFVMSNGNQIHLRRADLPTNPTNVQIATFLSDLGLANLI